MWMVLLRDISTKNRVRLEMQQQDLTLGRGKARFARPSYTYLGGFFQNSQLLGCLLAKRIPAQLYQLNNSQIF